MAAVHVGTKTSFMHSFFDGTSNSIFFIHKSHCYGASNEEIDEFYSQLGFIVGWPTVGVDVALEALNEIGYLL